MRVAKPLTAMQISRYRRSKESTAPSMMGFPIVLLTTIGARTGHERTHVLGGFPDGDDAWLVVASKGGAPTHPAWFINLAKSPDKICDLALSVPAHDVDDDVGRPECVEDVDLSGCRQLHDHQVGHRLSGHEIEVRRHRLARTVWPDDQIARGRGVGDRDVENDCPGRYDKCHGRHAAGAGKSRLMQMAELEV
ncbi:MAG: nitroreductase family deazaflavin-dependent oxidoreductase [Chloroflexi bacterium]|nr:MAG: nitroreductase family deazaflavin-dependent oxidoreductase [Chloroflexota bacterium]